MKANPKEGAMKRYLILMFALAFGLCATSVHAGRVNPAATQRDLTVPLAPLLLYPADGDSVLNGEALRWELPPDSEWAGTFDIYIDGILVSENLVGHRYGISGLALGNHTWYVVARNPVGTSPPSETRSFSVVPGVAIGNGGESCMLPIHSGYYYNYTQSIFLQTEINVDNTDNQSSPRLIESIAYYWNGMGSATHSNDWTIYMGHTDRTVFADSTDWLPADQMMPVFDGHLELPAIAGWIEIELDYPFVYNNTDNLVIGVLEHTPGSDGGGQYFHGEYTHRQSRSIVHLPNFAIIPDPDSPLPGYPITAIPNIRIRFGALPTTPILGVAPAAIDFGEVRYDETTGDIRVMVANTGVGTMILTDACFNITGPQAAEFSFYTYPLPLSLGSSQATYVFIQVTGITTGPISATLHITYAGQNCDVAMTAEVLPPGTAIIAGEGNSAQRQPFGIEYGYERSAALYTGNQIRSDGLLDLLAWDCASTSEVPFAYRIWLKNTDDDSLTQQSWQDLVADMTLVKTDIHTPNTLGWQSFPLHTPFEYMGVNLIVAVETNYGGSGVPANHTYRCSNLGEYRHQIWFQDNNPPTGYGHIRSTAPNIKLHFTTDVENDIAVLSFTGTQHPVVGEVAGYTLRIKNNSNTPQNNYQLKLVDRNNTVLTVLNGPPIESLQALDVMIPWTPTTPGSCSIRGVVQLDGDEYPGNDYSDFLNIYVHPEATQTVNIGAGDELANIPILVNFKNSLYQCIYLESELGFESGLITSMAIYNRFYSYPGYKDTKIYLGSTNLDNLTAGCIPAGELTLVFDGTLHYPAETATIFIPFQTPYLHTPGNLIVMFERPMDTQNYPDYNCFKCQSVDGDRGRTASHNYDVIDPLDPPPGKAGNIIPQATFYYNRQTVENDLAALSISGESVSTLGTALTYTIRIKNYGSQRQTNYTVKLLGADDTVLASVPGPALNSLQTQDVMLVWTPPAAGDYILYGSVEMDADQFVVNDRTAKHRLCVYPAGATALTIGEGNHFDRIPINMYYRNSLYQTLYYEDEMQDLLGQITGLQLYHSFDSDVEALPISIWMGSTTQADLTDGWIPAGQLTQVFDGHIDIPGGEGIVNILFDQPFLYLHGGNLVLLINKTATEEYTAYARFRCQKGDENRSLSNHAIFTPIDPYAPPPNSPLSGDYPKTTFMTVPGALGQISGTVRGTDGQPLSNATVSVNNGLFTATTDAAGEYQLPGILILPDSFISFNAYGYFEHTQNFELQPGEQLVIDANLQPLPLVNLSGTVVSNDTGAGIPDALVTLGGYGFHQANADASGRFTIHGVYAHQSYDYSISATGYYTTSGSVSLSGTDHDMGSLILNEIPYAPLEVSAVLTDYVVELTWQAPDPDVDAAPKFLTGYKVYRLLPSQEDYEVLWASLTPVAITTTCFNDSSWISLPNGNYRWAVKAVYTDEVLSPPSLSNVIFHDLQTGRAAGTVKDKNGAAIAGATITNGTFNATSNTGGAYVLTLPVGTHTISVSAPGYVSQSVENVVIKHDQHVILQFVLAKDTHSNDTCIPVTATALHQNYPNPFNPETTISYSVKESGRVRLEVYNIKGQRVKTLVDADHSTGHYRLVFNARDRGGRSLGSGVYLLRMIAPGYRKSTRMVLMQ